MCVYYCTGVSALLSRAGTAVGVFALRTTVSTTLYVAALTKPHSVFISGLNVFVHVECF